MTRRSWSRCLFVICVLLLIGAGPDTTMAAASLQEDPAVQRAVQTLQRAPDLESHLEGYQALASEMESYLQALEEAQPIIQLADSLRDQDIPLLGNAWQALTKGLDVTMPGAGEGLNHLVDNLQQMTAFRARLQSLQELDVAIQATQEFRANPTVENMQILKEAYAKAIPLLEDFDKDLQNYGGILDDLSKTVDRVRQALSDAMDDVDMALLRDALSGLNDSLGEISRPLKEMRSGIGALRGNVRSDLQVMRAIQGERGTSVGLPTAESWWLVALLIVALLVGGAFLFLFLSHQGRPQAYAPAHLGPSSPTREIRTVGEAPSYGLSARVAPQQPPVPMPHAQLRVLNGPLAGKTLWLSSDDVLLGRGNSCTLRIPDPAVSRRHARFRYAQGAWFLQDQNSTGGTLVNNRRVMAVRLHDRDQITVGHTTLEFRIGGY